MAARGSCPKPFHGPVTKRTLTVSNSAAAHVAQQVAHVVGQDAPSARSTTTMVVQGTTLGDSLTVVNEVLVPRPKPGTLKRALKEIIPHVQAAGPLRVPLHEAHSCRLSTMAIAHTSLASLRDSQGSPMPLAMVPSHCHYTLTHAHQRTLSSSHPRSPSPSTPHSPAPTGLPASLPATPFPHVPNCSPSTYLTTPSSSSHSPHFMSAAALHSHPATAPWSNSQQATLLQPTASPTASASAAASVATASRPLASPTISLTDAKHYTVSEATGTTCHAAESADASERAHMVQAVVAVVGRTTRAVQATVGQNSGPGGSSSSGSGSGTWEGEESLRALLQRHRTRDLAMLLQRLQQSARVAEVAEVVGCC